MARPATVDDRQMELPFALLEFHGRSILSVQEAAERLDCTRRHICNLIDAQELAAINIGTGQTRTSARIPVEAFRDFVIRSMTCPWEQSPLRTLPVQALIRLHRDLTTHLSQKGVKI